MITTVPERGRLVALALVWLAGQWLVIAAKALHLASARQDSERFMKAFEAAGKALVAQYDAYEVLPGEHLDGTFTLGENIGDLAGLTIAYDAYKKSLGGKPAPVIDGLTGDQRFFMGYAQVWRSKYREETARQLLLVDPHSPAMYRVNGIVRNFPEWYKAFGVKPGDALYLPPEQRIRIW